MTSVVRIRFEEGSKSAGRVLEVEYTTDTDLGYVDFVDSVDTLTDVIGNFVTPSVDQPQDGSVEYLRLVEEPRLTGTVIRDDTKDVLIRNDEESATGAWYSPSREDWFTFEELAHPVVLIYPMARKL
jgi:hypothetical protein